MIESFKDSAIVSLLRAIGSSYKLDTHQNQLIYSSELNSIAEKHKIPLMYLNCINPEQKRMLAEYQYHARHLRRLMEMISDVSCIMQDEGLHCAIFKTLRPYTEDVSDIDLLNLGSHADYERMVEALRRNYYVFMERGAHCTTFQDHKTRFRTEAMIDIYDEISVSRLIYLDKRRLMSQIVEKQLSEGNIVKVFNPEAELLVTIAHSAIKENAYTLAEYYATLCYLTEMNQVSIRKFIDLVRDNYLVKAAKWHFTITYLLQGLTDGITPEKLMNVLSMLGGPSARSHKSLRTDNRPYPCDPLTLISIFTEKLQDGTFRGSLLGQSFEPLNAAFVTRLIERLSILF